MTSAALILSAISRRTYALPELDPYVSVAIWYMARNWASDSDRTTPQRASAPSARSSSTTKPHATAISATSGRVVSS